MPRFPRVNSALAQQSSGRSNGSSGAAVDMAALQKLLDDRMQKLEMRLDQWGERLLQVRPHHGHHSVQPLEPGAAAAEKRHVVSLDATDPLQHGVRSSPRHHLATGAIAEQKSDLVGPEAQAQPLQQGVPADPGRPLAPAAASDVLVALEAQVQPLEQGEADWEKVQDFERKSTTQSAPAAEYDELKEEHKPRKAIKDKDAHIQTHRGGAGFRARKTREQRHQMMEAYGNHFKDMWLVDQSPGLAMKVTLHPAFDYGIGLVILINALLLGAQVQVEATQNHSPSFFQYTEYLCTAIFTVELVIRFAAHGRQLFKRAGYAWVCLDIILVALAIIDIILTIATESDSTSGASIAKMLKFVRMGRILRIVRMFRMVSELRLMVQMITTSIGNLFNLLTVLVCVIYCFAIALTKGAVDYMKNVDGANPPDADLAKSIQGFYGSLPRSMYSLFLAMTGGISWGDVTTPWLSINPVYFVLMVGFISFAMFSVLNIVTGVFVDGAIEMARRDRLTIVEKEAQLQQAMAFHLLELLEEIDEDGTGTIDATEFSDGMQKEEVKRFMDALQIDTDDVLELFALLDRNGDGVVDVYEFVEGMQRLKGEAKSADIARLAMELRHMHSHIYKTLDQLRAGVAVEIRNSSQIIQAFHDHDDAADVGASAEYGL